MKKNITINLFGSLYAIDEDAYELLNRYLSDMKKYFARKEGGEEIADDIEHRAAELMQELKARGVEAVTIEHVKEIISRIGSPEELEGGDETQADGAETETGSRGNWKQRAGGYAEHLTKKRIYRNPDDKMLGGVLSGLSAYLGIDSIWLRLLTVALAFASFGTVLLVYVIFWLVMPEAKTPEDRLRMQGKPVTMENLSEEIVGNETAGDTDGTAGKKNRSHSLLNSLLEVFALVLKGFVVVILGSLILSGVGGILVAILAICLMVGMAGNLVNFSHIDGVSDYDLNILNHIFNGELSWMVVISLFVGLVVLIYLAVHVLLRLFGKAKPMGWLMVSVYLLVLVVSAGVFFTSATTWGIDLAAKEQQLSEELREKRARQELEEQREWLENRGWQILCSDHTECYTNRGENPTNERTAEYIDGFSENPNMHYMVERTVRVSPGTYTIEAAMRTNGEGPELYVYDSKGTRHHLSCPANGNNGGDIWEEAVNQLKADSTLTGDVKRIATAHNGNGWGWNRLTIEGIEITDTIIRYGVSNRSAAGYWNGTWFSATDFKLKKEK